MTKWSIFWESKSNFVLINALIDSEPRSVQEGGNYDGQLAWLLDKPRVRQVTWEEKPTSLRDLPPPTGQRWLVGWVSRGGGCWGALGGRDWAAAVCGVWAQRRVVPATRTQGWGRLSGGADRGEAGASGGMAPMRGPCRGHRARGAGQ